MDGGGELGEVIGPGDLHGAELAGGFGEHLGIEEGEPAFLEVGEEGDEGDLGGIGDAMEHGFAGEEAADGDAVDATDEAVILPAFEAVGPAGLMELDVGPDEGAGDPGGVVLARGFGAGTDHPIEGMVEGDAEGGSAEGASQAAGDMDLIEIEDGAWIGRPPGDGFGAPGKDSGAIGGEETVDGEVAADGDETLGGGEFGRGKREGRTEDRDDGCRHGRGSVVGLGALEGEDEGGDVMGGAFDGEEVADVVRGGDEGVAVFEVGGTESLPETDLGAVEGLEEDFSV
jgi:hypothetical protein